MILARRNLQTSSLVQYSKLALIVCFIALIGSQVNGQTKSTSEDLLIAGCVRSKKQLVARVNPKENENVLVPPLSVLPYFEKSPNGKFYRVKYQEKILWVPSRLVELVTLDHCTAIAEKSGPKRLNGFSVFASYFINSSSVSFDSIITKVPNPDSVAALPNPIVSKIFPGKGYEFGGCYKGLVFFLHLRGCGSYFKESFIVQTRPNPAAPSDSVTLASLSTSEVQYQFQGIASRAQALYHFKILESHWIGFGLGLKSSYYLGESQTFEYRTGTVFKAESNVVKVGPTGFVSHPQVRLSYDYGFQYDSVFRVINAAIEMNIGSKSSDSDTNEVGLQLGFGF